MGLDFILTSQKVQGVKVTVEHSPLLNWVRPTTAVEDSSSPCSLYLLFHLLY